MAFDRTRRKASRDTGRPDRLGPNQAILADEAAQSDQVAQNDRFGTAPMTTLTDPERTQAAVCASSICPGRSHSDAGPVAAVAGGPVADCRVCVVWPLDSSPLPDGLAVLGARQRAARDLPTAGFPRVYCRQNPRRCQRLDPKFDVAGPSPGHTVRAVAMISEQERGDLLKLVEQLDRCVDPWCAQTQQPSRASAILPGSTMASDDMATDPFRISTAAWHGITAAVDHIRCFRDSLITNRTPGGIETLVRTHSQYTLLRAALENASLAVWLLAADDRAERITRRLRVEAASIEAMARLHKLTGTVLDPAKADRIAQLRVLAAKAGLTAEQVTESARPAGSGEAVRGAAIARGSDPVVAQVIWSMGSGVAHADFLSMLAFLDRDIVGEISPGVAAAEISGSVPKIYLSALASMATINTAFELYNVRTSA